MTVKDAIKYLKKFPYKMEVVLNVSDDEGLVYSALAPGGQMMTAKNFFATFAVDPHQQNLKA